MLIVDEGILRYVEGGSGSRRGFEVAVPPLTMAAGSVTAFTGINGSGKSTLLAHIAGVGRWNRRAEGAECWWSQNGTRRAAREVSAFLAASPLLVPGLSVSAYLALVVKTGKRDDRSVTSALGDVGLDEFSNRDTMALSSGERKRLGLARVRLQDKPLILLDEPRANLDAAGNALLDRFLEEWTRSGRVIVIATHSDQDRDRATSVLEFHRHASGAMAEARSRAVIGQDARQ